MAFRSSQQARIYMSNLALAAHARTASVSGSTEMQEVTTLADRSKSFVAGKDTSTFSVDGPLDTDYIIGSGPGVLFVADVMKSYPDPPTPITYMPLGTDGAAWLIKALQTAFDTTSSQSGTVDWSLAAQTDGISDMAGVVLENETTVTVDTNGAAVDNGAASSNGAVFHLHVTEFTGFTSDLVTVEGSATGAFTGEETTVATFSTVLGAFATRAEVAGTIPRYLRVVDDVTGVGSATRLVAVSRR